MMKNYKAHEQKSDYKAIVSCTEEVKLLLSESANGSGRKEVPYFD